MSDTKTKLAGTTLPRVIELSADATAVGKTTAAWRIRHHCDEHGVKTVLVTIESRGAVYAEQFSPQQGQGAALIDGSAPWSVAPIQQLENRQTLGATGSNLGATSIRTDEYQNNLVIARSQRPVSVESGRDNEALAVFFQTI